MRRHWDAVFKKVPEVINNRGLLVYEDERIEKTVDIKNLTGITMLSISRMLFDTAIDFEFTGDACDDLLDRQAQDMYSNAG